ncbi:hypothetical protein Pmani_005104 [Petrolisthes manimaculis]|uniref:SEC63 domain-containing protein n=1 Tax=Petrolisthes manimaculis TaxID=1843537 RepID=A0AAE1QCD6_9EUCA|nr:hypothetical protein Pmani_005104 [Petrolisthes manimaculis]
MMINRKKDKELTVRKDSVYRIKKEQTVRKEGVERMDKKKENIQTQINNYQEDIEDEEEGKLKHKQMKKQNEKDDSASHRADISASISFKSDKADHSPSKADKIEFHDDNSIFHADSKNTNNVLTKADKFAEKILTNEKYDNDFYDDDAEWERGQRGLMKETMVLEMIPRLSHIVHCPYYPGDKHEYWWLYVCERTTQKLISSPYHITNLMEYGEYKIEFTAPNHIGVYVYQICLRSDSYLGVDQIADLKFDVKKERDFPLNHPQWQISSSSDDSSYLWTTDDDDDDDSGDSNSD